MSEEKNQVPSGSEPEELSGEQLSSVTGGVGISVQAKLLGGAPKLPAQSIASGEITSDSLDNNLPGNGGGVIV